MNVSEAAPAAALPAPASIPNSAARRVSVGAEDADDYVYLAVEKKRANGDNFRVLTQQAAGVWVAYPNAHALFVTSGLPYCRSKDPDDSAHISAPWGTTIQGEDAGDGWIKVHRDRCQENASEKRYPLGKMVTLDCPRSADPSIGAFKGKLMYVKGSVETDDGWMYELTDVADHSQKPLAAIPGKWLRAAGRAATTTNMHHLTLEHVFKACDVYCVPVFQRRYCWSEGQWRKLWRNIVAVKDNSELNNHSLGRLMLMQKSRTAARLVLDGQQRLTTSTLLIAALRDRLSALGEDDTAEELSAICRQGRFVPTMDDRADFSRCLSEVSPEGSSHVVRAKRLFSELAAALDADECEEMADATLHRLSMLTFVIENEESVQAVYENLAKKQEMLEMAKSAGVDLGSCIECFTKGEGTYKMFGADGKRVNPEDSQWDEKTTPSTHWGPEGERLCAACAALKTGSEVMTPGVPMSPVDLVRNFVIDHFESEDDMRSVHATYWSPIEAKIGGDAESFEDGFKAFVVERGFPVDDRWGLYKSFLLWWRVGDTPRDAADVEAHARRKLEEMRIAMS